MHIITVCKKASNEVESIAVVDDKMADEIFSLLSHINGQNQQKTLTHYCVTDTISELKNKMVK